MTHETGVHMGRIIRRFALVCSALIASHAGAIELSTKLPVLPFASLPACGPSTGPQIYRINNASAVGACDGSGTADTECICDPETSTYRAIGGSGGGGGSSAFSALTGSTNTTAAMLVGTGASLASSGSGTIAATTAAALAANGSNASSGNAILGVDASGAAEGAFDVATQTELNTHTGATGTSAHGAASTNTASAIVARDGSGNFAAGTITAALTGNASTSTALAANGANATTGQFVAGVGADGAAEGATNVVKVGTTDTGSVACDFVGQGYQDTDGPSASGTLSFYACTVVGSPGTWIQLPDAASITPLLTVATDPNTATACTVVGSLAQRTDTTPDLLYKCDTVASPGVWVLIGRDLLGTASASTVACDFVGQVYYETDTSISSKCSATGSPGTWAGIDSHPYVPTTSADFPGFSTNTIHAALDYIATRVRYALAATAYDGFVDLTGGIRWAGAVPTSIAGSELQAVQEMLNPALDPAGSPRQKRYGVAGMATVSASDFRYRNDATFDLGYALGFGVIPANTFSGGGTAGWPLPITGASGAATRLDHEDAIEVDFNDAVFTVALAGGHTPANAASSAPLVLMQIGDSYGAGSGRGVVERGVVLRGNLNIIRTGDQDGSSIQGAIQNLFGSVTSFYGLFMSGTTYADMTGFRINCTGIFNGTTVYDDYDDTCVYMTNSWGEQINVNSAYMAVGLQVVGNAEGIVVRGRVSNGGVGALLGGPQGGDVMHAADCAAGGGNCADVSDDTDGVIFDDIVVEGNVDGGFVQMDGSRNTVRWGYWEPPTTASNILGHGICINCGVCAAGARTAMVCGRDADCPSSTCTEPAGVGSYRSLGNFDWDGIIARDSYSVPFDSLFIGDGATGQSGRIKISGQVEASHSILEASTTVAGLPTCNLLNKDRTFWVTDLLSSGSTTGGGSVQEQLYCTGAAYVNQGVVSACANTGSRCYPFGFGPSADAVVDVSDIYTVGGDMRWPPYPTLYHSLGKWHHWQVDETTIATGNCLDVAPNKTDRACAEEETHSMSPLQTGGRNTQVQRFVWRTASTAPVASVACSIDLRRLTNITGIDGGGSTMVSGILIHGSKPTSGGVSAASTVYTRYPHDTNGKVEAVTEGFPFAVSFTDVGMADECVNDDSACTCTGTNTLKAVADVYSMPYPY